MMPFWNPPKPRRAVRSAAVPVSLWMTGLLISTALPARGETSEEVLANHRKAIGGDAALQKQRSLKQVGTLSHDGYTRDFTWSTLAPGFFREDSTTSGLTDTTATDGKNVWNQLMNGAVLGVLGSDRDVSRVMGVVLSQAYLRADEVDLTVGEAENRDGNWVVPITGTSLPRLDLSFDSRTWLLTRATASTRRSTITLTFEDIKKVGDLKLPQRVKRTVVVDGVEDVTSYTVKSFDRKAELQEALFERPTEVHAKSQFPGGSASLTVPLELTGTNHIFVEAQLNNAAPATFVLDSGANVTVLDKAFLESLSLKPVDSVIASGTGGSERFQVYPLDSVRIGGVELGKTGVAGTDLSGISQALKRPIAGILGLEVFDRLVLDVRYAEGKLVLHDPQQYTDTGTGEAIPLDDYNRITVLVNGQSAIPVTPDTGAGAALVLSARTVERENLAPPPEKRLSQKMGGVGGQSEAYIGLLSSAQLGQLSLHNVVTMFHTASTGALADEEGMNLAGNLFFQRFNVTFDYPHRQLLVEQGPWFSKPFAYNRSGLKLKAGEGLILEGFTDGSAGTPETLLPGDELVAIAAEDGSWLTERAAIEARFREAAGTRLKLKIKRGKKELVRELELKESI